MGRNTRASAASIALAVTLLAAGCDDGDDGCPPGMICNGTDAGPRRDAGRIDPTVDAGPFEGDAGPPGTCTEAWVCTPWETDGTSDTGTRTCADANGCGTTFDMPATSATLPSLDFDFYECNVEPILDRGCAHMACHGTENGRALRTYHRGRRRITTVPSDPPSEQLHELRACLGNPAVIIPPQDCHGSVECSCWQLPHTPREWIRNFDAARGFAMDASGAALSDMSQSELLRQPEIGGPFQHQDIHFWRPGDADYQTILSWLEGASLGRTCNSQN